jgi:hypothetical protein
MKKSLDEASNTAERNQLIADYYPKFQDLKYKKRLMALNKMIESLSKGKTTPLFDASTLGQKKFFIESLKGK